MATDAAVCGLSALASSCAEPTGNGRAGAGNAGVPGATPDADTAGAGALGTTAAAGAGNAEGRAASAGADAVG